MDPPIPREIELKFTAPADRPEGLAQALGDDPPARYLDSVYFDTPDEALRRAGVSLRLRREDGRWRQTIKTAGIAGGIGRGEWEVDLDSGVPDLEHARATPAAVALAGDAPVEPKFTVVVQRRSTLRPLPGGAVEVSLDEGRALAQGRSCAFRELELELKSGEPAALFDLAADLVQRWPLDLSFTTKAQRGWSLVADEAERAAHFEPPALEGDLSAGDAFRPLARAALAQIAGNLAGVRTGCDAEAVHQMRVGARRLRATLETFRPIVEDARFAAVMAELKWLAGELDPARNLDVFLDGAWRRAQGSAPTDRAASVEALTLRLQEARELAWARAREAVSSARMRALLVTTLAWVETGDWATGPERAERRDGPAVDFAREALRKARRKVLRKGRRLDRLPPKARHKVRIRAKVLRYAADALLPLFAERPKRARRFVETLETLLDDLGELNDIATAHELAEAFPPAGELVCGGGRREDRLVARACARFGELAAAKPFWKG